MESMVIDYERIKLVLEKISRDGLNQGASFPGFGFFVAKKLLPESVHPFNF
jgi:hypothetical protein